MIASGLPVEGLHYPHASMTSYSEFLRPKPLPPHQPSLIASSRYTSQAPVNLTHKEDTSGSHEDFGGFHAPPPRMFPPSFPLQYGPYGSLYPTPYPQIMRHGAPLSPMEAYPPYAASPPQSPRIKPKPPPPPPPPPQQPPSLRPPPFKEFKAPPGKEGSLKHRILRKKATGTGPITPSFNKGSLIQLANGDLKRVEELKTEDFVDSAKRSTALQLDPSTVVRIDSPNDSTTVITLSYGTEKKTEVEVESVVEHPYFVFGRGWASCSPERTLAHYGLKCKLLQVGDVCISLTPRPGARAHTAHNPSTTSSQAMSTETRKRRWSAPDQISEHPPHHRAKESV